jgi:Mg-chelatase subunit ChlD
MSLRDALPEASRQVARRLVRQVVEDIERRLGDRTRSAARGALDRSARTSRPKPAEIDWNRTIRANLKHYQPQQRTVIPERLVGHARRKRSLAAELILALDQSGSMAGSVVYAGVLGAALASLPTHQTRVIAFDTAVVDLTDELKDPVDVLFGIQLGGGTDIDQALGYCQTLVNHPAKTVLILVTDLYEGGDPDSMLRRAASVIRAGVRLIVLLALSDEGAPTYDHEHAAALAALGAPVFACTPDQFPDMLAATLEGRDVRAWAADRDIVVA